MKKYIINYTLMIFLFSILMACTKDINIVKDYQEIPEIYPDYIDVTIPPNIAPLNFRLSQQVDDARLTIYYNEDSLNVFYKDGQFFIPPHPWTKLLEESKGKDILLTICIASGDALSCTAEGQTICPDYYGLEMVIAVAFRVQTLNTKVFRKWIIREVLKTEASEKLIMFIQNPILN